MSNRINTRKSHVAIVDGCIGLALAVGAVILGNTERMPVGGIQQFLGMRFTLLNIMFAAIFVLLWGRCFRSLDLYRVGPLGMPNQIIRVFQGCGMMAILLVLYLLTSQTKGPLFRVTTIFFAVAVFYELARVLGTTWVAARDPQLVVILGSGRRAGKAWRQLRTEDHYTAKLLGFVDDRPLSEMGPDIADRYIGSLDDLSEILLRNVVDELLIAMPMKSCYEKVQTAIAIAEQVGVRIAFMHDMYPTTLKHPALENQALFTDLVTVPEGYMTRQAVKRVIDVVGAFIGLALLSPVILLTAIAIKLTSKGPVFFVQQRYGYRRRLFSIYKFRSMVWNAPALMAQLESQNEADGPIFKIKRDPRITPLGRFLRASSLDELPQLWNVFLGNMSLVGPRPMSVRDVSLFSEATLMRRFTVKPGITGLWQVSGRSTATFDQWIKFDFHYIDAWSLALDLKILARTIGVVVKRTGAT
jgi:exopolysaccharide biosynthesis polyprenyl glycosylphosphotransferase